MAARIASLALVSLLSLGSAVSHAGKQAVVPEAVSRAQKSIAKQEFRTFVKSTPGMKGVHRWALVRATGKSAATGIVMGGVFGPIAIAELTPIHKFSLLAIGTLSALTGTLVHGDYLKTARTETVAHGVTAGKVSIATAEKWENSGLIYGGWR